ncbi:hypothetical protein KDX40_13250 [Burkholderia ambifaria]|uniref:hypothetical protein n=1 Tax=Burkholderia ambifaria TaxID=152480 RepID=UPI001B95C7A9|nr:hypothetical protein [Burkholderia ambifaria]MBR8344705.1 hypothetical protein [Burkholderia ambifaria]
MNKTLTNERIEELALLNLGYDRQVRLRDFARAIEREVLATQQPEPSAEVTDEVVQWGRVIEIGDRHGMQWAGKTGWRFENDDSVHAFANDIARFALNSRAGEGQ